MSGITVVSTALNAEKWAALCIASVAAQTVHARHVYVDAASTDRTFAVATHASNLGATLEVYGNGTRLPALQNISEVVHSLPDDEIVVFLDGDDQLATPLALHRVARAYAEGALATYGSFMYSDGRIGFARAYPADVARHGWHRKYAWVGTHLRTCRASLFKAIPASHLHEDDGSWIALAFDQALFLPVLEMARERAHFIPEILHVYNHEAGAATREGSEEFLALEHASVRRIRARAPLERFP